MKKIFKIFSVSLLIFFSGALFAENWYVCLGSFNKKENAERLVNALNETNANAFIIEETVKNKQFYRVLAGTGAKDKESCMEERNYFYNNPVLINNNLQGFWLVKAKGPEKVQESKQIVLKTNSAEEVKVSKEKPYSVLVNSYKDEQAAENDKNRLEKKNIESYIVKTYDDKEYFSFDLHAGSFVTEEEAEPLQKQLDEMGIKGTEITNYAQIEEKVENYNNIVKTQKVTYDTGNTTMPECIPAVVKKIVRQFPINKNFQVEEITIVDADNMNGKNIPIPGNFPGMDVEELSGNGKIHALAVTTYKDPLYNKKVEIFMAECESEVITTLEEQFKEKAVATVEFAIKNGKVNAIIGQADGFSFLFGTSKEQNVLIMMKSKDFSQAEFAEFLTNIDNDSDLLYFPQMRKTLLILPDSNASTKRDFLYFNLSRVDESYAVERNFVNWSLPIPGHWHANGYFNQESELVSVGFFDMDYDYNAKKIHGMFMEKHNETPQNSTNHSSEFELADAWYTDHIGGNEFSFSRKSYIIAVDANGSRSVSEESLKQFARDLRIWDKTETTSTADAK